MNDPTAEDRELAGRALAESAPAALEQLLGRYAPRLRQRAAWWLGRNPVLGRLGDADDLVQQFLADKVIPAARRRAMLGPVAQGLRALGPRLRASFDNFTISLSRRRALPMSRHPVGKGENALDPEDRSTAAWPDVTERVAAQLAAIRGLPVPAAGAVAYPAVLLLSERLALARRIARAFAPEDGRTAGNESVRNMVEVVAPWTPTEHETPLTRDLSLGEAWRRVCAETDEQFASAGPAEAARVVGITEDRWNQWVKRGRSKLADRLGSHAVRELFPCWPAPTAKGDEP